MSQCVCDADTPFLMFLCGSPGLRHDGRIWGESQAKPCLAALNEQGQTLDFNGRKVPPQVLADSAYPGTNTVMCPYSQNKARGRRTHRRFNLRLCKARELVELCIGLLKVRWRILLFTTGIYNFRHILAVVHACCILHNMCIEDGVGPVSADLYGGAAAAQSWCH